jgi:S1-C subfamily serine protease
MRLSRPARIAAVVLACASAPAAQAQLSPEELYRQLAPSVWVVRTFDADGVALRTGSAVVSGTETLLTNCHVLEKAKRMVIRNDNVQHDARLQYIDVQRDLCQITARNLRAPSVALADSDQLNVGQKVYALGNPRGLELSLSDGLISALRRDEDLRTLVLIQTTAPISSGSSGGGLFDSAGRLIGITTLVLKDAQNMNFAIPINRQRELAARSEAALKASRPGQVAAAIPIPVGDVSDANAVPVNEKCRDEYRKYVVAPNPKAFAITTNGRCLWQQSIKPNRPLQSSSPDPAVRAMEVCVALFGTGCSLYAVGQTVVFGR